MDVLNSLKNAKPGFYIVYEQSEGETGLDIPVRCYVGPFKTNREAENHEDGPCKRVEVLCLKAKRTYYGFQMGFETFPGSMDVVTTHKPDCGFQVKCRASTVSEAREKLDTEWNKQCEEALRGGGIMKEGCKEHDGEHGTVCPKCAWLSTHHRKCELCGAKMICQESWYTENPERRNYVRPIDYRGA